MTYLGWGRKTANLFFTVYGQLGWGKGRHGLTCGEERHCRRGEGGQLILSAGQAGITLVIYDGVEVAPGLRVMIYIRTRGLSELVQHLANKRRSHWRKGANKHLIYMVWPIQLGRRGVFYYCSSNDFCLPSQRPEEGGGSAPYAPG